MASWLEQSVIPLLAALGGGGAVWGFLKAVAASRASAAVARIREPAELLGAMGAFQEALNRQAEAITADLRAEVQALKEEAEGLRERIVELEEENLQCRGENREMKQRVGSLEAFLRRQGIDLPGGSAEGSLTIFEDGRVTVLAPVREG